MDYGRAFRVAMAVRNTTVHDVAHVRRLNVRDLERIAHGHHEPSIRMWQEIAACFGVDEPVLYALGHNDGADLGVAMERLIRAGERENDDEHGYGRYRGHEDW